MQTTINIKSELKIAIDFVKSFEGLITHDSISEINFKEKGIVYIIYVTDKNNVTSIKYIGKSKGVYFKTRIRNHFIKKNKKTGAKLELIKNEFKKGNNVRLKYIETQPESYRNMLEEELINHFFPIWNIQKRKN